ncbi:hypothetical protein, partial [Gulosibacter hominis]|uniref:hypothetical protein n=1 Tax=Gulosibacter hominis TaxID=2770504 RepID=UPI001E4B7B95
FCADGTARGTLWESRSLPNFTLMVGCMIRFGGLCAPPFFVSQNNPTSVGEEAVVFKGEQFLKGGQCF